MSKTIDCLFIGYNEVNLTHYEKKVREMGGKESTFYRDLSLSIVEKDGEIYTPIDLLNRFRDDKVSAYKNKVELKHSELNPAIACLGTFMQKKGLTFDFINMFQDEKEALIEKLTGSKIHTIAITTTLYFVPTPILEIISFIKQYNQEAAIIVGGPFIYTQYLTQNSEALGMLYKAINADFYIINSQGEAALAMLVNAVKNKLEYNDIPNLVYKSNNNQYITNKIYPEDNPLDESMVDWSLFSPQAIGDYVSLRTSLSCPFNCAFCSFPSREGKFTYIEPSVLEANLNLLTSQSDVRVVHFIDSTFNAPKERFKDILRMMIKNKYRFKWNSMFRCQYADRETIELMKESNCQGVFLGIESGSDRILKNMNKNATADQYRSGMELLREYDIITYASFVVGFPGETEDTAKETVEFIKQTKPTFYRTQLWFCDPMTPIWKEKDKYELQGGSFVWSHKTMNSTMACDLIDQTFTDIRESIWLTQLKFEFTNLYYLLNKGMSLEQLKDFLSCFNALVGNKLKSPEIKTDERDILEKIRKIALFDHI